MAYIITITKSLLQGAWVTVWLFALVLVLSFPLGLLVMFLTRVKFAPVRYIARAFIYVIRGTPLLLQLFFVFYGVKLIYLGITGLPLTGLTREMAAVIAFTINYAAYFAEIFRGGLLSIDKGQFEACKVLGLNKFQTNMKVILPQMFRVALPSVTNESVTLLKDTALIYAIAMPEILHYAKVAVNRDSDITAFGIAAVIYLVANLIITLIFRRIEKKMDY